MQFVARLRNIAQHQRLPLTSSGVRAWRDDQGQLKVEQFLVLDRKALLRYQWKDLARDHVEELSEDPRLAPVVTEYATLIRRFADWLAGAFVRANLEDFEELFRLHERLGPANALFRERRV